MPNPLDRRHLAALGHRPPVASAHPLRVQRQPSAQRQWLTAPMGAPNVLLVLIDGMSWGASSPSGGSRLMPTEELEGGEPHPRVHTAALRSPTPAAANGRNHTVDVGHGAESCATDSEPDGIGPASAAMLAKILSRDGYATGAFGPWHPPPRRVKDADGPFDGLPDYAELDSSDAPWGRDADERTSFNCAGTTSVKTPRMQTHACHLAEVVIDHVICWVDDVRTSSPEKPWFAFVSFGATHETFRERGSWQCNRSAERPIDTHAAFSHDTDAQVRRFLQHLQRTGELDSTIVLH